MWLRRCDPVLFVPNLYYRPGVFHRDAGRQRHARKHLNSQTYSARLTIPPDDQGDVGKTMGLKNDRKTRSSGPLGTRDYRTAVRSRDAALDVPRSDVDKTLLAAGLKPPYRLQPSRWSRPAWLSEALRE